MDNINYFCIHVHRYPKKKTALVCFFKVLYKRVNLVAVGKNIIEDIEVANVVGTVAVVIDTVVQTTDTVLVLHVLPV